MIKSLISQRNKIVFTGKNCAFFGDSIVDGTGASDSAHRYTSLFCAAMGAVEVNRGIGGEVLQNGTVCGRTVFDKTTIPAYDNTYAAMFIALGVNDIGTNNDTMTPEGFSSTLADVIDYAIVTKGWPSNLIIIASPSYVAPTGYNYFTGSCSVTVAASTERVESYIDAGSKMAYQKNCRSVNFYYPMISSPNVNDLLSDDKIHPNDLGYANMAATAENVLS